MKYKFRFLMDWGSGTILWSADEYTKKKYDYPVDHNSLNLKPETIDEINNLIEEYDKSFDPQENAISGKINISEKEAKILNDKIHKLATKLQKELNEEFEIIDEYSDI